MHPALRASLQRARLQRPETQRDLVTIVIPMYKVEDYLAECLDSVVEQTYKNLEIILVDDGSPDGSYEIARSYARWDPRIRIIRQQNRGLGAARNTGVAEAHGRFLCFADSDDVLPKGAIAAMIDSLRSTKSDFVVGAPIRMRNGRTWTSGWVKEVHGLHRERVRLDDFPEVLKDVFAWNKLFDAEFFRRVVGGFPEGIRYEDQEPTAKAYIAGTFDVLATPVYYWRVREDGTSITQQKADPNDLRDRLVVKNMVSDVISSRASKAVHDIWLAKAIGFDLRSYYEQVPRTDAAFFEQLRTGVQALARRMTPEIWELVPILDRLPALATLEGNSASVTAAVTRREEYGWFVPAEVRDDGIYLERSFLDGLQLDPPDEQLRMGPADLQVHARATSLWWHDTTLRLQGHAYLTNLPYDDRLSTSLELVSSNGLRVPLAMKPMPDPRIDLETKDAWNTHQDAGFTADIDPTTLPLGATEPWRIEVTVSTGDYSRTTVLKEVDVRGIAGTRPVAPAQGNMRWMAGFEEGEGFTLRHTTELEAPVSELRADGRSVTLTVNDPQARMLRLSCRSLRRNVEISGSRDKQNGTVTFAATVPELINGDNTATEHIWSMRLHGGPGEPRRLTYHGGADELNKDAPEHGQVRVVMTRAGTLRLAQNRWWAVAEDVIVEDEELVVRGRISAQGARALRGRMVSDSQIIHADQATMDLGAETFTVRFPFNTGGRVPTTRHGFSVRLSVDLDGRRQERWLKVADGLQHRFPADSDALRYGVTLTRTKKAAALWVRFRARYQPFERGRLAQRRLHQYFRTPAEAGGGLTRQLRPAVLFESFNGRNVSDSVLAIFDELRRRDTGLELFWSVSDLSTPVPDGAHGLLMHSQAWMDMLHNARYVVNNANFPFYYRKRTGQTYVQTWHGTPLKRIGNDVPLTNLSLPYRQLMQREADYWDVLIAQNDFAAETLPKAFGFDGPTLNVGYPRNDALVEPGAEQRRKDARSQLGVDDDQQLVLYAPTWRDNVSIDTGYAMVSFLDFDAARRTLGDDTVFLQRGHANTAHQKTETPDGVIDVTRHPDINDLILASDLLITDYSSVMFDYCVTGKPILFLTPDLDQYRDVTRGFYLDFEQIAPGPICRSTPELQSALADPSGVAAEYADRYRRFTRTFAPHDDGAATVRVVDAVWGGQNGSG